MAYFWTIQPQAAPHLRKTQEISLDTLVAGRRPSINLRRIVAWALDSWPPKMGLDAARETTLLILRFDTHGKVCIATRWRSAEFNLPQPAMKVLSGHVQLSSNIKFSHRGVETRVGRFCQGRSSNLYVKALAASLSTQPSGYKILRDSH